MIGKWHKHIHYAWGVAKDNPAEIRHLALPVVENASGTPVSVNELNRLITDIRQLVSDLEKPIHDLRELWPPTAWDKRGATPQAPSIG